MREVRRNPLIHIKPLELPFLQVPKQFFIGVLGIYSLLELAVPLGFCRLNFPWERILQEAYNGLSRIISRDCRNKAQILLNGCYIGVFDSSQRSNLAEDPRPHIGSIARLHVLYHLDRRIGLIFDHLCQQFIPTVITAL